MPEPQPFIVGRQSEIDNFAALVEGRTHHWLLNIYGPGGIGKSVVCSKFADYARSRNIPFAVVDGIRPDLTPDRVLYAIMEGVMASPDSETFAEAFREFSQQYEDYLIVQNVLQRGGGVQTLFDVVGNIKDPVGFTQIVGSLGKAVTQNVQKTVSNRFALERYLRGIDKTLTNTLANSLKDVIERSRKPLTLLVDTYEEVEGLDDWVCRTFVPALPTETKVVVFGRNALPKVNFDWNEFGDKLYAMDLPELPEVDAKAYLMHHGLHDQPGLDQVYRFAGGYPLLLVLVVHLSREAGGWDKIGSLERSADRDFIATQLLERILREERVAEVKSFLEKGVIARWFNPEIVGVILEVSVEEARAIYDKLQRHSFVERHPYGLKFHDKIRELLVERLKFTSAAAYQRLTKRLMEYYAEKAGLKSTVPSEQQLKEKKESDSKYNIFIQDARGVAIGDEAKVKQTFESGKMDSRDAKRKETRKRRRKRKGKS